QDIAPQDFHTKFFYDNPGNLTEVKYYIGADLFLEIHYEYGIPNRNPYLGLAGINFGFPFYTFPLFDNKWESRASAIYYDEGVPFVISDQDPAQTHMQTGQRNYMTHVTFYDRITSSAGFAHITYIDCGNNIVSGPELPRRSGELNAMTKLNKILSSRSADIKQEMKQLKQELQGR
ncbi:MAG TPA: hypothetical protein VK498_09610, partial [Ferruginibacter sp.]|nr:hypothetical protein [Ferruginibacter sp.]